MKVLVAVKRVIDPNVKVRLKPDGSDLDLTGLKAAMNPFDENAVEAAVRLKEAGKAREIVAVSLGAAPVQEVLRQALAMGADRAIQIVLDAPPEPLAVAKLLKALVARESPGLVLLGKQAIDDDAAQTGQMLAALLGWGQGTFASDIQLGADAVQVTREIDGGRETVALRLPAVITADLRLNEPRYVKLPNLMMAKKKPIETLSPAELGADVSPRLRLLRVAEPPARPGGKRVASVEELVEKLRSEARVLQ